MATRQYIGARFTIKVYENSVDPSSAEWQSGVAYEPITLVTYNNSSYLSKKAVPANIGDPANNPSYWVVTGAYNGQILALQQAIDTINNTTIPGVVNDYQSQIDTINNTTIPGVVSDYQNADANLQSQLYVLNRKRFIVLSDSYGNYTDANGHNFIENAYLMSGAQGWDFHVGGAGFTRNDYRNFKEVLSANDSIITDKTVVTDIIVCGATNDVLQTEAAILSGMQAFMTYVTANYPNATVHVGAFSASIDASYISGLGDLTRYYMSCATRCKMHYIENSQWVMHRLSYFRNDDAVHPTNDGIAALSLALAKFMLKGSLSVFDVAKNTLELYDTTWGSLSADRLLQEYNNGMLSVVCTGGASIFQITPYGTWSLTAGINTIGDFLKVIDGFFLPVNSNSVIIQGVLSDGTHSLQAQLYLKAITNFKDVRFGLQVFANEAVNITGAVTFTPTSSSYQVFA